MSHRAPSRRARGVLRHVGVGAASLAIVASAAAYATSPAVEAIGATAKAVSAAKGKETIKGRVLDGKRGATGTVVTVTRRVKGKSAVVARVKVATSGRFTIRVRPGTYTVVLTRGKKVRKAIRVSVRKNTSVFVSATVKKTSSGRWSLIPVIFNY